MKISSPFSASSSNTRKRLLGTASCSSSTIVLPSEVKEEELEWKKGLPPGVKFVPSQEEFIYYLLKKVYTRNIDFGGVIRDIDLYKYEPEDLEALAFEGESRLYFFTPLQKKYTNGTRKKRDTVHGFWKGTQRTTTIKDNDNKPVITKTPFCYYRPRGKNGKKTQWLMDEYRLTSNHDNQHIMLENWALCVVHYKKRGEYGNNNEKEDNNSTGITNRSSSSDSTPDAAIGSTTSQTSLISASACAPTMSSQHRTISFGYINLSVGGSSSSSQQPQPNWSYNVNPKKQQQSSTSDEPFASHYGHDPSSNKVSVDHVNSDIDFNDSTYSDLYTMLHDESLQYSSLPQQGDDDAQKINPSLA